MCVLSPTFWLPLVMCMHAIRHHVCIVFCSRTCRYWALKLLRDAVGPGDEFVATATAAATAKTMVTSASADTVGIYAQGVVPAAANKERRVVLVNKQFTEATVTLVNADAVASDSGGVSCYALIVDVASGQDAPRKTECDANGAVVIGAFASAVVYLK